MTCTRCRRLASTDVCICTQCVGWSMCASCRRSCRWFVWGRASTRGVGNKKPNPRGHSCSRGPAGLHVVEAGTQAPSATAHVRVAGYNWISYSTGICTFPLVAAANCLCICALYRLAASHMGLPLPGGDSAPTAAASAATDATPQGATASSTASTPAVSTSSAATGEGQAADATAPDDAPTEAATVAAGRGQLGEAHQPEEASAAARNGSARPARGVSAFNPLRIFQGWPRRGTPSVASSGKDQPAESVASDTPSTPKVSSFRIALSSAKQVCPLLFAHPDAVGPVFCGFAAGTTVALWCRACGATSGDYT